jgi:hypothetical protein
MRRVLVLFGLAALAGCMNLPSLNTSGPTQQVANHPFNSDQPPATVRKASFAPASPETAFRVDRVGQQLIAANAQAGVRPFFGTVGAPATEVFHVGTQAVYITEGLAKQCKTDRELAAVLASELGKMISDREAAAGKQLRDPDAPPPSPLPIGGHGYAGDADPSLVFEQAKFEKRHPRQRVLSRPDPNVIARTLLQGAGQQPSDLQAVQPLLEAADRNLSIEQQFKGTQPKSGWQP